MLDIAWPELMVIGIVAVVAIGPKDLPKVMNTLGKLAGKARMMAQDVQRSMEQLNYEADVADRLKTQQADAAELQPASATTGHSRHHGAAHAHPAAKPVSKDDPNDHLGST